VRIRRDACLTLSNIAGSRSQHVVSILEHPQLLSKVVRVFQEDEDSVCQEICFIFCNMAITTQGQPLEMNLVSLGVMPGYMRMLQSESEKSIECALQCLSLITEVNEYENKNG
jgi:hypothetical protein